MLILQCGRQARVVPQSSCLVLGSAICLSLGEIFKEQYRNHNASFLHTKKKNETELSNHIWTLKDAKKSFQIRWKVLKKCQPYNNISKKCNLCLQEKLIIICKKNLCSLNRRNELARSCPHKNRFVLKNFRAAVTQQPYFVLNRQHSN